MEEKQANTGAQLKLKDLNKKLDAAKEAGDKDEIRHLKIEKERTKVAAERIWHRDQKEHQAYLDKKGRER